MSRRAWIVGLIVAALLVASLYRAKYGARESEAEVRRLKGEIAKVEQEILILRNEYSHLSRPEWVAEYAQKVLGMRPPVATQIVTTEDVAEMAEAFGAEGGDD